MHKCKYTYMNILVDGLWYFDLVIWWSIHCHWKMAQNAYLVEFFSKICFAEITNLNSIWPNIEILISEILFLAKKSHFPPNVVCRWFVREGWTYWSIQTEAGLSWPKEYFAFLPPLLNGFVGLYLADQGCESSCECVCTVYPTQTITQIKVALTSNIVDCKWMNTTCIAMFDTPLFTGEQAWGRGWSNPSVEQNLWW